ncbi:vacuolar protein sorting-associated protein 41 homolog [Tubulanus polymorphus]|uniref:vacuolar protein sorting-associated protein 41 homolog n=1 Tax=Tubulanus polymorphus TaxID=672921 RepID=UPI003DA23823
MMNSGKIRQISVDSAVSASTALLIDESENDDVDDDSKEGDDDEETSTTEEEEEEDEEPTLKYDRIGNDVQPILDRDSASCIAVHLKFLALGTHWGMIHILDHMGYNIRDKEISAHTTAVNQISIDDNGDYLASCSDDGNVVITGLYGNELNYRESYDRPVRAVAIAPNFYQSGSGRQFVSGHEKLIHQEKGLFNRYKSQVIHQGEGPIRTIKWRSCFIAWANDLGVKVFDVSTNKRITNIPRDHHPSLRAELYRCNICWKDDRTFMIGWADGIKTCVIKDQANTIQDLPSRYVEIVSQFKTDFYVCGLAPLNDNILALTYDETERTSTSDTPTEDNSSPRPHLRILAPEIVSYEELSNDALSIRGFNLYRCNDYHLESLVEDKLFFIVSPQDIAVAKIRDHDDHIAWLLEHHKFEDAMNAATEHSKQLKYHNIQEIGRLYLDYLLQEKKYDEGGKLCRRVLGNNRQLWEEEVYKFAHIHQLKAIAPFLPKSNPKLDPAVYEMVLNEFLQTDEKGFENLIEEWPTNLYNIKSVIYAVVDKLNKSRNEDAILHQCLAELYVADMQYEKALSTYLRLKNENAFDLIHKHNLFDSISDKIVKLMRFDKEKAVQLFIDNIDKVPIEKVVDQLRDYSELLHVYLDALFTKDPHVGQQYHGIQVALYAEYDYKKLLPFLRSSNYLPLQKALDECRRRTLIPEMVFLLGRMGNTKQALELITNELQDVDRAIDFCKEHDDIDLWKDLIDYSIDKPKFITSLLNNIGTHVDPIHLIRRIPAGMEIPGLRDSLVKIMQDFNLQIALRAGCKKILVSDCYLLLEKSIKTQKRGIRVEESQVCDVCQGEIIVRDLRFASNVITFFCKHSFHEECVPTESQDSCSICSSNTLRSRGPGNPSRM